MTLINSIWDDTSRVIEAVIQSTNFSEVLRNLGRSVSTAQYRRLRQFIIQHEIDISHFAPLSKRHTSVRCYTNEELFCLDSKASITCIKQRLKRDQLIPYVCEDCNTQGMWCGKQLSLQVEHKDGNPRNNLLTNLCYLCPNCHSQTSTYCGRNKSKSGSKQRNDNYRQQAARERNLQLIHLVEKADIDFSVLGWSKQVGLLISKPPQKVKDWMMRYLPELYKSSFHRKERSKL